MNTIIIGMWWACADDTVCMETVTSHPRSSSARSVAEKLIMHKICSNYVVRIPLTHRIVFDDAVHFTHTLQSTAIIDTSIILGLYD